MNKFKANLKKFKVLLIAMAMLICVAISLGVTAAYFQGTKSGEGTLFFENGILLNVTNIDKTAYQYVNNNSLLYYPNGDNTQAQKLSVSVLSGEAINVAAPQLQVQDGTVAFNARVKLNYAYYIVGDTGSQQQVDAEYFDKTDAELEQELITNLVSIGYEYLTINDEKDLFHCC